MNIIIRAIHIRLEVIRKCMATVRNTTVENFREWKDFGKPDEKGVTYKSDDLLFRVNCNVLRKKRLAFKEISKGSGLGFSYPIACEDDSRN